MSGGVCAKGTSRYGRAVVMPSRHAGMWKRTRDLTLNAPTADPRAIRQAAGECLKRVPLAQRLRLLGVRASALLPQEEHTAPSSRPPHQ